MFKVEDVCNVCVSLINGRRSGPCRRVQVRVKKDYVVNMYSRSEGKHVLVRMKREVVHRERN